MILAARVLALVSVLVLFLTVSDAKTIVFDKDAGGIAGDDSLATAFLNGQAFNASLAKLEPYDRLVFPSNKTFYLMGGVTASGLRDVVIEFNGVLVFNSNITAWPRSGPGKNAPVLQCLDFSDFTNVTFTSNNKNKGLLDGQGGPWWGFPGIGYLQYGENRPKLFNIRNSKDILIENLLLKDSPYWTFYGSEMDGLEIRYSEVNVRRTEIDAHDLVDLSAFNTDGFDVTGKNVWIHDCEIWNQDDCIAVKGTSENMLFERIKASGLGLTIGSIGSNHTVRNITFRDCYLNKTVKGIYLKFRDMTDVPGSISDVLYENIVMDEPEQWPIWIGPAQQSDTKLLCAAHPCSICWPTLPSAECNAPVSGTYKNIVLRNITINNPLTSPGVIFGNDTNPIQGLVFDSVVVNHAGEKPWGDDYYFCEGVKQGKATGNTFPVPPCFEDATDRMQEAQPHIIRDVPADTQTKE